MTINANDPGPTDRLWIMQHRVQDFYKRCLPPDVTSKIQYLKLVEEIGELAEGLLKNDPALIKDALADCLYVLCGIANLEAVDLTQAFNAVHRSNMTKTRDGSYSPKGEAYLSPDFENPKGTGTGGVR